MRYVIPGTGRVEAHKVDALFKGEWNVPIYGWRSMVLQHTDPPNHEPELVIVYDPAMAAEPGPEEEAPVVGDGGLAQVVHTKTKQPRPKGEQVATSEKLGPGEKNLAVLMNYQESHR